VHPADPRTPSTRVQERIQSSRRAVDEVSTNSGEPSARRPWLAAFAAFNALGAWGGAVGLMTGAMSFGARLDDRLPFDSRALAGLALATIVAVPLTVLAWSAWTGSSRTDTVALAAGLILIAWIILQIGVLRAFSPFQPVYLCIGTYFVAASHRLRLR
jgi:hypothetical protein